MSCLKGASMLSLVLLLSSVCFAGPVTLFDWGLNLNGTIIKPGNPKPAGLDDSAFDWNSGFGILSYTFVPVPSDTYNFIAFFDHEIDETTNTFFNEFGVLHGTAPAGFTWEIDEPGYTFGNIYAHFLSGVLDNLNGVPFGTPDDVSVALGISVTPTTDTPATVWWRIGRTVPAAAFYLEQNDPQSLLSIYMDAGTVYPPEPAPMSLCLLGLAVVAGLGWSRRRRASSGAATVLAAIALGAVVLQPCQAVTPVVKTVPWVAGNALIPHDTWSGKTITLKGTSDVQGATIQYIWDFGDGTASATGTVTNKYAIEAKHAYTGPVNLTFTARLTVRDTSTGDSASKEYYVTIQAKVLDVEVNVAVDEGLWQLHKTQTRSVVGGGDFGDWGGYYGLTAANVNAFEVHGHLESGVAENPYVDTVRRGMRRLFQYLTTAGIGNQTNGLATFNPDSNGNGLAVLVNQSYQFYQGGMFIDAIVATGTPDAVATTGVSNIAGRTYKAIVQDMVDAYAYCQYDGAAGGGWRYSCNEAPDNSACQWAAIGLIAAERNWGVVVPKVVKDWNKIWLRYSFDPATGAFGYTQAGYYPWGPYATTPSGMVQMAMNGVGRGDPMWDKAETFMRDNFPNSGGPTVSVRNYYYGLFSLVKAMLLHDFNGDGVPDNDDGVLGDGRGLKELRSQTPGKLPINWYRAEVSKGDATDGVARKLVTDQRTDGSWSGYDYDGKQNPFETAWAIMMLTTIIDPLPVAVPTAVPNPAIVGQVVKFDGSESYHRSCCRKIVSWAWDLDGNGSFETAGPQASRSFPALGTYDVWLQVTDDGVPAKADAKSVTVVVTIPPVAPTAEAGGPYYFCFGTTPWYLDGTRSANPDEGAHELGAPGNTIISYVWDLGGSCTPVTGAQPDVSGCFSARGVGQYKIGLTVADNTAVSHPSSGKGNLSSADSGDVYVRLASDPACACITTLAARPKESKVQLTWTQSGAHHYNIYRSRTQGGPYSMIGTTASTFSTYLDTTVSVGATYYYVVRPAQPSGVETCQSNESKVTVTAR